MWNLVSNNTFCTLDFAGFLESDEYKDLQQERLSNAHRFEGDLPSLLDIVEAWLGNSHAILRIPSHAALLVTIFEWIDDWVSSNHKMVLDIPLWEIDGVQHAIANLAYSTERDVDKIYSHPVLSPELFAARKEAAESIRLDRQTNLLEEFKRFSSTARPIARS